MDVLFFAIQPPLVARSEIVEFTTRYRRVNGLRGRPRSPSLLHVPLFGIGQYPRAPREVIDQVSRIADTVTTRAFDVAFDEVETFGHDPSRASAHVLTGGDGVIGVFGLRDDLGPILEAAGFRAPPLPKPHVTIHYDRGIVASTGIPPIRWRVEDFVLIRSLYGESRHEVIGRWPLAGSRELERQRDQERDDLRDQELRHDEESPHLA